MKANIGLLFPLLLGAGYGIAEQGPVAAGTGGAGTAREGDPAAAWYNPAALADGRGMRVGLGIVFAKPRVSAEVQGVEGVRSWEASRLATPPHLYLSYATGEHAFGLAAHVPYGAGVSWPEGWDGRFYIVSSQLEFYRLAPFYAHRFGAIRLALGLHLDLGRLRLHRMANFVDAEGAVNVDLSGSGMGAEGSLFWTVGPSLDLGMSIKSGARIAMSGDFDIDDAPDAFSGKVPDQRADATMYLPHRAALGVRWHEGKFAALCDVAIDWWQVNERLVIDLEEEQSPDVKQEMSWRTVASLRGGAEYAPTEELSLRAGLFVDPSPVPDETLSPSSPDSTRAGGTLGVSYALGSYLSIDAFYEYMRLATRESKNEDSLAATYSGSAQLGGVGIRYLR